MRRPALSGFLSRLPEDVAGQILDAGHAVDYPARCVLARPELESAFEIVLNGLVRLFISAPDGRQITVRYGRPGFLLGGWRIAGAPVSGGCEVLVPSRLLHLDPRRLRAIIDDDPRVGWALLEEFQERLVTGQHALALRAFGRVRARVAHDLVARAAAANGLHSKEPIRASHQDLAEATGSVREVVARAVRELEEAGVIAVKAGCITVKNPARLQEEAQQGLI